MADDDRSSRGGRSEIAAPSGDRAPLVGPAKPTAEAIARRAYERFRNRGETHGWDVDDWLAAERELSNELLPDSTSAAAPALPAVGPVSVQQEVKRPDASPLRGSTGKRPAKRSIRRRHSDEAVKDATGP